MLNDYTKWGRTGYSSYCSTLFMRVSFDILKKHCLEYSFCCSE